MVDLSKMIHISDGIRRRKLEGRKNPYPGSIKLVQAHNKLQMYGVDTVSAANEVLEDKIDYRRLYKLMRLESRFSKSQFILDPKLSDTPKTPDEILADQVADILIKRCEKILEKKRTLEKDAEAQNPDGGEVLKEEDSPETQEEKVKIREKKNRLFVPLEFNTDVIANYLDEVKGFFDGFFKQANECVDKYPTQEKFKHGTAKFTYNQVRDTLYKRADYPFKKSEKQRINATLFRISNHDEILPMALDALDELLDLHEDEIITRNGEKKFTELKAMVDVGRCELIKKFSEKFPTKKSQKEVDAMAETAAAAAVKRINKKEAETAKAGSGRG